MFWNVKLASAFYWVVKYVVQQWASESEPALWFIAPRHPAIRFKVNYTAIPMDKQSSANIAIILNNPLKGRLHPIPSLTVLGPWPSFLVPQRMPLNQLVTRRSHQRTVVFTLSSSRRSTEITTFTIQGRWLHLITTLPCSPHLCRYFL